MSGTFSPQGPPGASQKRFLTPFSGSAALLAAALALGGCARQAERKPEVYELRGRVVDAETEQPVAGVRLLLRAVMPTLLGRHLLSAYGVTAADGTFAVALSMPFEAVRQAQAVRLDVSHDGYLARAIDVPPPAEKEPFYKVPDIALARVGSAVRPGPVVVPGGGAERPAPSPLPWQR